MAFTNLTPRSVYATMEARDGSGAVTVGVVATVGSGGAFGASAGTLTHRGDGLWEYVPSAGEWNQDEVHVKFTEASAVTAWVSVYPDTKIVSGLNDATQPDLSALALEASLQLVKTSTDAGGAGPWTTAAAEGPVFNATVDVNGDIYLSSVNEDLEALGVAGADSVALRVVEADGTVLINNAVMVETAEGRWEFDGTATPMVAGKIYTVEITPTISAVPHGPFVTEIGISSGFITPLTEQQIRDSMKLAPTAGTPAVGSVDEHLDDIDGKTANLPGDPASETNVDAEAAGVIAAGGPSPWTTGIAADVSALALEATAQSILGSLPSRVRRNAPIVALPFIMYDITGDPFPALTVTATRSIDGGAFAPAANAPAEMSNGAYKVAVDATDVDAETILWRFTAPSARDTFLLLVTNEQPA